MADELVVDDFQEFKHAYNKTGKPPVPEQPKPVVETSKVEAEAEGEPEDHPGMSRRDRRRMNQLIREAAEAKGRADTLEAMLKNQPKEPKAVDLLKPDPNTEPNRNDFKTDVEYNKALTIWTAKQEINKNAAESESNKALEEQVKLSSAAFVEQIATIPDWEDIQEKASDIIKIEDQPFLQMLFGLSDYTALVVKYLVEKPEEWEKLAAMKGNQVNQAKFFHRLEGRVEAAYSKIEEKSEEKSIKKPTATELDAKKPKPSEAITPKGGTSTDGTISMLLDDGKTLNPAYKAQLSAKLGYRA